MDDQNLLTQLGVNTQLILSGFAGGVVKAFYDRDRSPWIVVGKLVSGLLVANYLGPVAVKYTGFPEPPTGFIVGFGAMLVAQGIVDAIQTFIKKFGSSQQNGKVP